MSILNIITYNALAEMTKKSLYYKKSLTDKRFKYKIKYIIKLFNKVINKVDILGGSNHGRKNESSGNVRDRQDGI